MTDAPGASGPRLPTWFWLLPVLAVLLWWPIDPFWASDDFLAIHYAKDPARALADVTHWQYGATDLWFFYRPLITLSFCFDAWVAGGDPFWAHLSNVLAHGVSALLVGLLWRRPCDDGPAFAAGLLWAIAPSHVGTISWAVGRVDAHTTVWCLLCVWFFVRGCEGRRGATLASLLAFVLALASKELALALPGLLLVLGFALHGGSGPGQRVAGALARAWPHVLVLLLYLLLRIVWLGRFGGYLETTWSPAAMAKGLGSIVLDLVNPLRWTAPLLAPHAGNLGPWLPWLGWLPVGSVLVLVPWRRRLPGVALVAVLFLLACVPVAGFLAGAENHHNLRYFYFPFAALAGLLASAGRLPMLLLFAAFVPAFVAVRHEQWQADHASAAMHRKLVQQAADHVPGPWFVAGLPHSSPHGTAIQFHFGIDRMLEPPFGPGGVRLFAHRPILPVPGAVTLAGGADLPVAPPLGTTFLFQGPELLTSVPREMLPVLPVVVDGGGGGTAIDLSAARLQRLKDAADPAVPAEQKLVIRLRTPGVHTPALRVTIFTSTGYLAAVVDDGGSAAGGELDLLRFFETARWAGGDSYVLRGLEVPSILDLVPEFPVLLEGGRLQGGAFVATHRARELLTFRFDRDFPRFVRRALGLEPTPR